MNIDYGQFYRGTTNIPSYGNGTYKKDTLVRGKDREPDTPSKRSVLLWVEKFMTSSMTWQKY